MRQARRRAVRPAVVRDLVTGGNHRLAILLTGIFFVAALVVLAFVDERRGRAQVE